MVLIKQFSAAGMQPIPKRKDFNMKKILILVPVEPEDKSFLESKYPGAVFTYSSLELVTEELILEADIIVGNAPADMVSKNTHLELLQLNSAGADEYIRPGVIRGNTKLANATGAYGLALSEHMLGMLLMLLKKLEIYHNNQKERKWRDEGSVMSIYGSRTLILGLGDIGGEFAKRMKAMGSYVVGIKRRITEKPEYVDEIYTMDELDDQLKLADIVFMALPGTEKTYRIMDKQRFACMKANAVLLNCGRGTAIDQDALTEALKTGRIYGAAIDVTDPEPLPEEHPMWEIANLLVTPHISGQFHLKETLKRIIKVAGRNLEAVHEGREVENEVDFTTGYKL